MTVNQLRAIIVRHQSALDAWQPIYDEFDKNPDFEYFDNKSGPLDPRNIEVKMTEHEAVIKALTYILKCKIK